MSNHRVRHTVGSPPRTGSAQQQHMSSDVLKDRALAMALQHCEGRSSSSGGQSAPPASPYLIESRTASVVAPSGARTRAEVNILMERIVSDIEDETAMLRQSEQTLTTALRRTTERLESKLETLRQMEADYAHGVGGDPSPSGPREGMWDPVQTQLVVLVETLEARQRINTVTGRGVQEEVRRALESLRGAMAKEQQTREANLASVVTLVESVVVGRLVKQVQDMRTDRVHRMQCTLVDNK